MQANKDMTPIGCPMIYDHRLQLFPSSKRNFAEWGRLSLQKWRRNIRRKSMNGLIYLVGLVVVILAVLSFFGLR
jgi:hypothetical protein